MKYRRISVVRLSDDKVVLELVSDQDPNAKRVVEDRDAVSCLCRALR